MEIQNKVKQYLKVKYVLPTAGAIIVFFTILWYGFVEKKIDTAKEIAKVEEAIESALKDIQEAIEYTNSKTGKKFKLEFIGPDWSELEHIWKDLSWTNTRIAQAKLMMDLEYNPEKYSTSLWNQRFKVSKKPWDIDNIFFNFLKITVIGILGCAAIFLILFLAIWVLAWTWNFVLDRIRELSKAIKGQ